MKRTFHVLLKLTVIYSALASVPIGAAAVQSIPKEYDPLQRPDPQGKPTEVRVGIYVYDVAAISDVERTCTVDLFMIAEWSDPRLAKDSMESQAVYGRATVGQVWNPNLLIANNRDLSTEYEEIVTLEASGIVRFVQRFKGTISFQHDLREFPFDSHNLLIEIVSRGYGPEEISLVRYDQYTGQNESFTIADWHVGEATGYPENFYFAPRREYLAGYYYDLPVKRLSGFYIWKVIAPLCLIIFMSWTVFWMKPEIVAPQIGISTASMLTLIIFQFTLSGFVPRISYLTRIDRFSAGAILLVFLALLEVVVTSILGLNGREEISQKIDRWSRFVFPVLFVLNFANAFLV